MAKTVWDFLGATAGVEWVTLAAIVASLYVLIRTGLVLWLRVLTPRVESEPTLFGRWHDWELRLRFRLWRLRDRLRRYVLDRFWAPGWSAIREREWGRATYGC